jgi:hypothetical protein
MQERETGELEMKIKAWRARMSAALPGQEETVRELEAHLRDHIEVRTREGMAAEAAFEEGVKRVGEPRALAREFTGGGRRWFEVRPMVGIYALFGVGYATMFAWMFWRWAAWHADGLLTIHVLTILAGYLTILAAGFAGLWTMIAGWRRASVEREIESLRRQIFRLTVVGSALVPVGIVLGMIWAARNPPHYRAWSWEPVEIGALAVVVSTWLLLLAQVAAVIRRRIDDRVRAVLAILGAAVVGVGWFAKGLAPEVPIAWACGAAILAQGTIAFWQVRAKRGAHASATT